MFVTTFNNLLAIKLKKNSKISCLTLLIIICTGTTAESSKEEIQLPRLSEQIDLEELWFTLGECLSQLDKTPDNHAVLILQPAVEAFFLVHAGTLTYLKLLTFLFYIHCKTSS